MARRNGIPVRLSVDSVMECKSMVSHLAGYYRLCEKWSFSLCSLVHFPVTLDFCMANNVHGPVTLEFVEEKFRQKSRQK